MTNAWQRWQIHEPIGWRRAPQGERTVRPGHIAPSERGFWSPRIGLSRDLLDSVELIRSNPA